MQINLTGLVAPLGTARTSRNAAVAPVAADVEPSGETVLLGVTPATTTPENVLIGLDRSCALDRNFGDGGVTELPPFKSTDKLWSFSALAVTKAGAIVVAGSSPEGWEIGEFTPAGSTDMSFGHRGWATLPDSGARTPSEGKGAIADIAIGGRGQIFALGSDGQAACCLSVTIAELTSSGRVVAGFGSDDRAGPVPDGSFIDLLGVEQMGDLLAVGESEAGGTGTYGISEYNEAGGQVFALGSADAVPPALQKGFVLAVALLAGPNNSFYLVDEWARSLAYGHSSHIFTTVVAYQRNGSIDRHFDHDGLLPLISGTPLGASIGSDGSIVIAVRQDESCRLVAANERGELLGSPGRGSDGSCGSVSGDGAYTLPSFGPAASGAVVAHASGLSAQGMEAVVVGEAASGVEIGRYLL